MTYKVYRVMAHFLNIKGEHIIQQIGGFFAWGDKEINLTNNYSSEEEAILEALKFGRTNHMMLNRDFKDPHERYAGYHIEPYEIRE